MNHRRTHHAYRWMLIILFAIISSFPFYYANQANAQTNAGTVNSCVLAKRFENNIQDKKEELIMMEKLQEQRIEAKEIMNEVSNREDVDEIKLLAEALEDEAGIKEKRKTQNFMGAATAGLGSTILATYIVRKLNNSTRGMTLRQRFVRGAVLPERGQRLRRYGFNSALILSTAATFKLAREYRKNKNEANYLYHTIEQLNKLRDLKYEIQKKRSEIQHLELILSERIIELEDQGSLKFVNNEIQCH